MQEAWTKERIHKLLDEDDRAVVRAALAIYARQTADEQVTADTKHNNGVGFSGYDAEPMTRFVRAVKNGWRISPKWMNFARKRMKHYHRQLVEIANAKQGVVPSTPSTVGESHSEPAGPQHANDEGSPLHPMDYTRKCTCEWGDGEPEVTCPKARPSCCTGGELMTAEAAERRMQQMEALHDREQTRLEEARKFEARSRMERGTAIVGDWS